MTNRWFFPSVCEGYDQYCGGIASVLWGIFSVLWRLISTAGDSFSTVGDSFSTVEGIQDIGGYLQCMRGSNISTVDGIQYSGGHLQYSGDKDLKYYEFSKNFEIFSSVWQAMLASFTKV